MLRMCMHAAALHAGRGCSHAGRGPSMQASALHAGRGSYMHAAAPLMQAAAPLIQAAAPLMQAEARLMQAAAPLMLHNKGSSLVIHAKETKYTENKLKCSPKDE